MTQETTTTYTTTTFGDRVAFDRYGDGPALVFVAGAGPITRAGDDVTRETAERAAAAGLTTLVFDRLGRGESLAEGELTLERELAAVAAMIDVAGGSAALCGHSSGCTIALAAAHAGLPVTALALWEAPLEGPSAGVRAWIDEFERRLDAGDHVGALEQYMKDMPPEWLAGLRQHPQFDAIARMSRTQRADGRSLVWAVEALEDGTLGRLNVPVVALVGTSTLPVIAEGARWLASVVPGAQVREVAGEDHSWQPEAMARALVRIVREAAGVPTERAPR